MDLDNDNDVDKADWELMKATHWHHFDSFYEVFLPYEDWVCEDLNADAVCDEADWEIYKSSHLHHALDERIRNLFGEEYYTWEYVLGSYDYYADAVANFQALIEESNTAIGVALPEGQEQMFSWLDWISDPTAKQLLLDFFLNGALEVRFCRTTNCPFYWTLFNELGDAVTAENDAFIRHFDGVHHVLSFGNDSEDLTGIRTYTLCANSNWNGDTSCVDLVFNITVTSNF